MFNARNNQSNDHSRSNGRGRRDSLRLFAEHGDARQEPNPPIGHYEFCRDNRAPARRTDDNGPMQLTEAAWKRS